MHFLFQYQVSFQLRKLADKKGADEERFNQLADTVESFTFCLLDPLRSKKDWREEFGDFVLDHIIDDATELDQKKVFLNCRYVEQVHNFGSKGKNKFLIAAGFFFHRKTVS